MRRGDVLVRVRLDPDGHPQHDRRAHAEARRSVRQPVYLGQRVNHDPPDPGPQRAIKLGVRLVVAMQADVLRRCAGPQHDSQLTAGAGIQAQPVAGKPAGHLGAEERLARVVDVGAAAEVGKRMVECVPEGHRPGPEIGLVEHVRRRAVLGREIPDIDPADL